MELKEMELGNIQNKILTLRRSMNLNQEDFSNLLGCSRTRLSRIESGELRPTQFEIGNLIKINPSFIYSNEYKFLAPNIDLNESKESPRLKYLSAKFSLFCKRLLNKHLDTKEIQKFEQSFGLEKSWWDNPISFNLVLRTMQYLIMKGHYNSEETLKKLVSDLINNYDFWGPQRNLYNRLNISMRTSHFLENWQFTSQNHHIEYSKDQGQFNVTFGPKMGISKELYFNDFVLKDFTGNWAKWWWHYFLDERTTIKIRRQDELWRMQIILPY